MTLPLNPFKPTPILLIGDVPAALTASLVSQYELSLIATIATPAAWQAWGAAILSAPNDIGGIVVGEWPEAQLPAIWQAVQASICHPLLVWLTDVEAARPFPAGMQLPRYSPAARVAYWLQLADKRPMAQPILVASIKGGVGKTLIASSLAAALAAAGRQVALIDDDPSPSIHHHLGLHQPSLPTSADLVAAAGQEGLTASLVQAHLTEAHGIHALRGPGDILTAHSLPRTLAGQLLHLLGTGLGMEALVVDAPPDLLHSASLAAVLLSERPAHLPPPIVIVPVVPEKNMLHCAQDTVALLQELGVRDEHIWPVITCAKPEQDPEEGIGFLSQRPVAILPYSQRAKEATDAGIPLFLTGIDLSGQLGQVLGQMARRWLNPHQTPFLQLAAKLAPYLPAMEKSPVRPRAFSLTDWLLDWLSSYGSAISRSPTSVPATSILPNVTPGDVLTSEVSA